MQLSDGAFRLHLAGLSHCCEYETDGFVAENYLSGLTLNRKRSQLVRELCAICSRDGIANLWEQVEGGWVIHDFLDYNPSRKDLEEKRRLARERMAKVRANIPGTSGELPANEHGTSGEVRSTPTRPDPTRPVVPLELSPPTPPRGGDTTRAELKKQARVVFVHWQEVHNHPKAQFDSRREARIRARFKEGYTVDQLKLAISNAKHDKWLMGENPDNAVHDAIKTVLRDAEMVDRLTRTRVEEHPPLTPAAQKRLDIAKKKLAAATAEGAE